MNIPINDDFYLSEMETGIMTNVRIGTNDGPDAEFFDLVFAEKFQEYKCMHDEYSNNILTTFDDVKKLYDYCEDGLYGDDGIRFSDLIYKLQIIIHDHKEEPKGNDPRTFPIITVYNQGEEPKILDVDMGSENMVYVCDTEI